MGIDFKKLGDAAIRRTLEGAGALASAADKGLRHPERAAYVAATAVNVGASLLGAEKVRKTSKVLLMPLLAASVVRRRAKVDPVTRNGLLVALGAGWLGDLLLLPRHNDLNKGAAAFAVNHIAYSALLWRHGARPNAFRAGLRYPLWAASSAGTAAMRRDLLPAAAGYGFLLATTSMLGDDSRLTEGATVGEIYADPRFGIGHGGNLFLISDALLLLRAMVGEGGLAGRILDAGVMDTYTAAQLLLTDGLLELGRR